jgi:uncharacterized damage-inducible protein DinB
VHPRVAAVLDHAEAARATLLAAVDSIPAPLREARPTLDAWSAAEVLEHLARVERGIAKLLALKVGELRAREHPPMEAETATPFDETRFLNLANGLGAMDAPERTRPQGELSADAAREALLDTRRQLREQLLAGDGLALSSVTHPHPAMGELTLYEWVYFVGAHEARHARQVRAIANHFAAS